MRGITRSRDDEAVAPVIAEILLVAITVTLAATLFLFTNTLSSQSISNRPFVAFTPVKLDDGVATITIAGASRNVVTANYRVNLQVGATMGSPVDLAPSGRPASLIIGGATYRIAWTDVGGSGALAAGDPIVISAADGPLPAGMTYGFFLIWTDGSVVQSSAWST